MILPVNQKRLISEFIKKDIDSKWQNIPFSIFGAFFEPNLEPYFISFANFQDHLQVLADSFDDHKYLKITVSVLTSTNNFNDSQIKEILEKNALKAVESIFDVTNMPLAHQGHSAINRKHLFYLI